MIEICVIVETILFFIALPSATPRSWLKTLINTGVLQKIITDIYHWIRKRVKILKKSVLVSISRDNLTTKWVNMFSRRAWEYIISYKLMIHKQTTVGLEVDLFTHISVEIIYNIVNDFNTHRCMLDFDTLLISLLLLKNNEIISRSYYL